MTAIIGFLNTIFWQYVLIYGLLAVGLFFTVRLGFLQFVHFDELIRSVVRKRSVDASGISPLQALMVSLASRVGVGNLTGVAVALYLGGAGAIFWMWVVALLGMATAYAEATLAQLYKTRSADGLYRGGPAFYISKGLGLRWLGSVFSVCLIVSFGLVFKAVQANSIAAAIHGAFGVPTVGVGAALAALTALVIFGGIRKIALVAEFAVPFMALSYLLLALYVLAANLGEVPGILARIVGEALGWREAGAGVVGGVSAAMMNGVRRGLFSNEAGMGSAPNIAAVATPVPHHPSSQGFVQALGPFIDTIVICTATAIIILLSGVFEPGNGLTGINLTQQALVAHIGAAGRYFIAIAIFFFAFTSIIGNYSYSENAMVHLGVGHKAGLTVLRIGVLGMVVWGAVQAVGTVFDAADAAMGLMATINLVAIVLLSGTVVVLTRDFFTQRRAGRAPTFIASQHPELPGQIDRTIWRER